MDVAKRDDGSSATAPEEPVVTAGAPVAPFAARMDALDAPDTTGEADELERAIQDFLADVGSGVVSASRVVNPLLQVWSVAREVDAEVAVPVENLLSVLVKRSLTTSQELEETMTEVRAVRASTRPLAGV